MVRTQIYLTEAERTALASLSETRGTSQSELIREAVDQLIAQSSGKRRQQVLENAAGLWKERKDLPDFAATRKEWDRGSQA